MPFKHLKKQHGFTLFELIVVILLVGVFMSFAIDRMLRIQIDAERVSVQQTIATLKSAVILQVGEMVVNNGINSIATLENTNPMNYLQELPYNYSGLKSDQEAANYPLAEDELESGELPKALQPFRDKLYGLTIAAERLVQIRKERRSAGRYASPQQVSFELRAAEAMFKRWQVPFVDTTRFSIEEISSTILSKTNVERRVRPWPVIKSVWQHAVKSTLHVMFIFVISVVEDGGKNGCDIVKLCL